VAVPDYLQPRRLATLLSNLRPKWFSCFTSQRSFHLVVALGTYQSRVFIIYLTVPPPTFPSIWPLHSFGTSPTIFKFIFFSGAGSIRAGCDWEHLFSVHSFYFRLSVLLSPHLLSRSRTTLLPRHILSTASLSFTVHVSLAVHTTSLACVGGLFYDAPSPNVE
jgi:hypothetical protein